jgi:hypothetical protein
MKAAYVVWQRFLLHARSWRVLMVVLVVVRDLPRCRHGCRHGRSVRNLAIQPLEVEPRTYGTRTITHDTTHITTHAHVACVRRW